jgi:F-type H+-transporting ATPase subunit epsilon
MAKSDTFQCSVITPERVVLDTPATFVAFPAHDGEVGIMTHRAPLVYKLGTGTLRVKSPDQNHVFYIDGGFAQMNENRLTILTEQAKKASEIQPASADKELSEARAMPAKDEKSQEAKQRAVRRAKAKIKVARQNA